MTTETQSKNVVISGGHKAKSKAAQVVGTMVGRE